MSQEVKLLVRASAYDRYGNHFETVERLVGELSPIDGLTSEMLVDLFAKWPDAEVMLAQVRLNSSLARPWRITREPFDVVSTK